VVTNAGTILLDSLVNQRPSVCVLFDEGAPPGECYAEKNVTGVHYRDLMLSEAFYQARSMDETMASIARCISNPGELAQARSRVVQQVVGTVDGLAAERVIQAIVGAMQK